MANIKIKGNNMITKAEKKKAEKLDKDVLHTHKHVISGTIHKFGFPHLTKCKHKNKKTQMMHDITVKIDSGDKGALTFGKSK
jgi:hypothetical protein